MAISPPTDLVLDVVRAADPAQVQEAQAKLKSNKAAFEATSLAEAGAGFQAAVGAVLNRDSAGAHASQGVSAVGILNRDTVAAKATEGVSAVGAKAVPEHLRKFETMVLQNFVKSMMPTDSEETYGKGTAGEMWRGMMADQLGEALGKGGGIGIAESLVRRSGVTTDPKDKDTDRVAAGMVQALQREAFADLTPGIKQDEMKA